MSYTTIPHCGLLCSSTLKWHVIHTCLQCWTDWSTFLFTLNFLVCNSACRSCQQWSMRQLRHMLLSAVYNDINLKWLLCHIHRNIHLLLLGFVCFLPVALLLIEWTEKAGDLGLIIPPTLTPPRHISKKPPTLLWASYCQCTGFSCIEPELFVWLLLQKT